MPAISIIIPVYNVEKYLRRCLDSVLNQTFTDWQAICVNDGSPDNSAEILAEYAARDKRFIVITKENGGLSDARNAGLPYAEGEYIMYLDSDDFIHPQTMEIAYFLAKRDGSDMVSFTYDRLYRAQLMIRYVLGLDTTNITPMRKKKKFKLSRIPTRVTRDIYRFATERSHNPLNMHRKWLIKHCQVWKNMYKRELIADTPFIKGLLFEDFPWWSVIMMKNPQVTIAPLPLYFYVPNFGGIVLSTKQLKIMQNLLAGLCVAYTQYKAHATDYQMKMWSRNFRWYFIKWSFRKKKFLNTPEERAIARKEFRALAQCGALDNPHNREWRKLRDQIQDFIREDQD